MMTIDLGAMSAIDVVFFLLAGSVTLLYVWRLGKISFHDTRWPWVVVHLIGLGLAAAPAFDALDGVWDRLELVGIGVAMLWLLVSAGHWRHGPPRYARLRHDQPGEFRESRLP